MENNKNSSDYDDDDYIGSDCKLGSFSDGDYEFSEHATNVEKFEHNVDLDWTTAMQYDEDVDRARHSDEDDDSDVLYTPNESGSDEEHEKFPSYKSGESLKFELGMVFSNKQMERDALKQYVVGEEQKMLSLRKMMQRECSRTTCNMQEKATWLAKKFGHILRHNIDMKPAGLIAHYLERRGVILSHDHTYRAKRKVVDLLQGAGLMFERIYVCLEACKHDFAKYCRPLIGLDACFLKGDFGGQLMEVVGRDGNNKVFPIAYAIMEVETKDSWDWFIELLLEDLKVINQRASLAIKSVSAHIKQRLCVKHLYGNWKRKNHGL
ncbi:uncharacterized protein LOC131657753 [Vicia villosa]|uniref:uncharacterized protein LOC131657753 n=1 Tax=Vicia villosa TaxID=3911 RepID=UPI00273AA754|nr:uncharacterized protein LOC131657753 [Vicia villosa]